MKIDTTGDMVNIESPDIFYGNIRNCYTTGNGHGLQLAEGFEENREKIGAICDRIADAIYELNDAMGGEG